MVEKYLLLLALKFMGFEMDDVIQDSGKVVVYTLNTLLLLLRINVQMSNTFPVRI